MTKIAAGDYDPSKFYITGSGSGITFSDTTLEVDTKFKTLEYRIDAIEKRLAIINPNKDLQSQFPALQEAYDHYKVIEKLVKGGKNG